MWNKKYYLYMYRYSTISIDLGPVKVVGPFASTIDETVARRRRRTITDLLSELVLLELQVVSLNKAPTGC